MLHHYLQKGHKLKDLLNLSYTEKLFYIQSMILYYEEEADKWKELTKNE